MRRYPVFIDWKLILLKYPYYLKQSINSMQYLWKFQWHFQRKENPKIPIKLKESQAAKAILNKKRKQEEAHYLISKAIIIKKAGH